MALALLPPSAAQRLAAQAPVDADRSEGTGEPGWARASLDIDLRIAETASRAGLVGGVRALVEARPAFRVGLGGHQMLKRVDDARARIGLGRTLSFGYAGAVAELDITDALPLELPRPLIVRLLGGVGVITVRDQAVGTRIGSELAGIVEPGLASELLRAGRLAMGIGVSYRWAFAVDGPASIRAGDIRSPAISAYLRFGPF